MTGRATPTASNNADVASTPVPLPVGETGPNSLADLRSRIERRTARISVFGLGYVGIPVAASFAVVGFSVQGFDVNPQRAVAIDAGQLPLATDEPGLLPLIESARASGRFEAVSDQDRIRMADVIVIAVDTPIDADHRPDIRNLVAACDTAAGKIAHLTLVIIESTVAPGTMRHIVSPIFARVHHPVFVINCPERLRPGRLLRNLRDLPRLVGAADPAAGDVGVELYRSIVDAQLTVLDWESAEMVKTAENAARDVQIALANQLAIIADHSGVDFRVVREQINALWRDEPLILQAGPGVGGHCLPKDPWLLVSAVPPDAATDLIHGARAVNAAMPKHVAWLAEQVCEAQGTRLADVTVAVLGLTYTADSDDPRNAPGREILALMNETARSARGHDVYLTPDVDLLDALTGVDLAIVVAPHHAYRTLRYEELRRVMGRQMIIDCTRVLDGKALGELGFAYRALGVGDPPRGAPGG